MMARTLRWNDEFSGTTVYRPVTNLFRRTAPRIVHLSLDAPNGKREVMKVTSEHPFFVKGKGWTEVRKLALGDQIVSGKGGFLAIANMRSESQPTLVYNFEVAQNHNYFVGEEGALAHNAPAHFWKRLYNDKNIPKFVKGWIDQELRRTGGRWSRLRNPPGMDCGHYPRNRDRHDDRSRLEWASDNRSRPGITGNNPSWR